MNNCTCLEQQLNQQGAVFACVSAFFIFVMLWQQYHLVRLQRKKIVYELEPQGA